METLIKCPLCASSIEELDSKALLSKCAACGYIFDNPRPTKQEIIAYYSKPAKYDLWLGEEGARELLWKRRLKLLLATAKKGSLLDVGAGIGQLLALAKPYFSEIAGTEVSKSAVELAKSKYGLSLFNSEVETIDFGSKKFDNITLFHVLEHVHDPKGLVACCHRLLNPGGMLYIAVPNDVLSLKMRLKRLLNRLGVKRYGAGKMALPRIVLDGSIHEIHLSHFTPQVLAACLEKSGFKVVENSLDPYYAALGSSLVRKNLYFGLHKALKSLLNINLYDTIWIAAKKA